VSTTTGPRVVSLVPSSTETLLALGAAVVACTRFCEQPELRHVGGTKNPDIAAIVALAPDLVVMDREENRREDAELLAGAGLELFVSDVRSVADAGRVVAELAARVGRPSPPFDVGEGSQALSASVFVPIWRRPWMSINSATYGASLLAHLGVGLVTADAETAYPEVDLADIRRRRPSAVLVPSEPYVFEDRHLDELRRELGDDAGRPVPVVRVDGQDLFWWGSRTPAAAVRLRAALSSAGVLE
jgi:ABC-type Fe3+-hydroxamate transport system substrate-binding protein